MIIRLFQYFILPILLFTVQSVPVFAQNPSFKQADSFFFASDWKNAKLAYEHALSDTSHNAIAWNRLGFSNYNLNLYPDAERSYKKSLASSPSAGLKGVVFSRMAKIHAMENIKQKAIEELDSAVSNGYVNLQEIDSLKDFNSLREEETFKNVRKKLYAIVMPCMVDPHNREFDFWIGDWDVYQAGTNNLVGHNTIQLMADGCGLLENWTSLNNRTGKSLNFIDPVTNKWKQVWVGGGNQEFVNGEYKEGAMRFIFETVNAQGAKITGRFIFFNEGPDQVRQFNELSGDNGKTWTTSYNFTYIRKK